MNHYRVALDNFIDIVYIEDENITSIENARNLALSTYAGWMTEEMEKWADINDPTEKEKEHWNFMIEDCVAYIEKYNPATAKFDIISPEDGQITNGDLLSIGWVEYELGE